MNFIEIPRCKITLRCNYNCLYCPILKGNRKEIGALEWLYVIQQYDTDEVILEGGEPTLHRDFTLLCNLLDKKGYKVRIYTNGSFDNTIIKYLPKMSWYVSYHNHKDSAEVIARTCRNLIEKGHRLINVHTNEGSLTPNSDFEIFNRYGFVLQEERNYYNGIEYQRLQREYPRIGVCSYPRIYLDPTGTRYQCVSKLEKQDPTGIILGNEFPSIIACDDLSQCSVCDIVVEGVIRK